MKVALGPLASALIALLPLLAGAARPQPRSYDTHAYYALELPGTVEQASAYAATLGQNVELVERIGELEGHWLVRSPHAYVSEAGVEKRAVLTSHTEKDPVMKRHQQLKKRGTRGASLAPLALRKREKRVTPQVESRHLTHVQGRQLRRRGKRQLVAPPATPAEQEEMEEMLYAQTDLAIKDPLLPQQWHLINTRKPEYELNVTKLWSRDVNGKGVTVAIIDDGLDMTSDDLAENFFAEGSYDFNDHTELPMPRLSDDQHGTRCAGEIAAVPNDVCGVGVSYRAKVAGVRILSAPISDADEAAALNYEYQKNDIYSCSWGPPDDGKSMEAPEGLILKAMVNGVQKGRGGKGSVFVFAAGNGGGAEDQCNFDGYTNSIFSITVGAIDRRGLHPYYSEQCAAMMIVAPSSGSGDHISAADGYRQQLISQHTTDVGKDKCAHTHGGTSAAAPLAVGVFALALQVRPDLTWRDLQHIAIESAVHINADDPDWELMATGRNHSYKYGFGMIDAGLFVERAESWTSVKPQAWFDSPAQMLPTDEEPATSFSKRQEEAQPEAPGQDDPSSSEGEGGSDNPDTPASEPEPEPAPKPQGTIITEEGITSTFTVTRDMLDESNLEKLEHITARIWITHDRRGDVEVELKSPNGIVSVLARARRFDEDSTGFDGWKFMSLRHWGEDPVGEWVMTVKDTHNPDKTGRFIAWSLQLWGEAIDADKVHDWAPAVIGEPDEEETGSQATHTQVSQKPKPTDHLPEDHGEAGGESHEPGIGEGPPVTSGDEGEEHLEEGWFDGVSDLASNTHWMAGAGAIVVLAGVGVGGVFALRQRQKRRSRNLFGLSNNGEGGARGSYAPVAEDVPMGPLARTRRALGGGGASAAQSKDLYDAFGDGPSDEDSEEETAGLRGYHDGFLDDEDEGEYRDDAGAGAGVASALGKRDEVRVKGEEKDSANQSTTSSGSWLDTADELK